MGTKVKSYLEGVHPGPYIHEQVGCPKCEHEDPRKCFELRYGFAKREGDTCDCGCHKISRCLKAEYLPLR